MRVVVERACTHRAGAVAGGGGGACAHRDEWIELRDGARVHVQELLTYSDTCGGLVAGAHLWQRHCCVPACLYYDRQVNALQPALRQATPWPCESTTRSLRLARCRPHGGASRLPAYLRPLQVPPSHSYLGACLPTYSTTTATYSTTPQRYETPCRPLAEKQGWTQMALCPVLLSDKTSLMNGQSSCYAACYLSTFLLSLGQIDLFPPSLPANPVS